MTSMYSVFVSYVLLWAGERRENKIVYKQAYNGREKVRARASEPLLS